MTPSRIKILQSLFVLATLLCGMASIAAQTTGPQDFTFQVSAAAAWTDSALDLQAGDTLEISATANTPSQGTACDPAGVGSGSAAATLPLSSAPAGALIARLHPQGAVPLLVGAAATLHIEETSHLFLGMNFSGTPTCQGSFTVNVHKIAASEQTRNQHLKSELSAAAKVFMAGQFGKSESEDNSSAATPGASTAPLNVSTAPLDAELRHDIDGLPRRVNDQFQNLGDMVNFVIVGDEKDVQAALEAATWHVADTNNKKAVLSAIEETYKNEDYLSMPMSTLYLFGRRQDFGYEMAEPIAMVASRHHFRIWKAPFTWHGKEVWVGAGTHDIGFAKDKRNGEVTHKIDPAVDGERDNIGSSLEKVNKTKTLTYYLPPDPVQDAKNATGDGYHSDGRLLVVVLQ